MRIKTRTFQIIYIALLLFCCSSSKLVNHDKNSFYASSVKEGFQILTMYQYELVKIDTLIDVNMKVYLFHYRK